MFTAYYGSELIYIQGDDELRLLDQECVVGVNEAGEYSFTTPLGHPANGAIGTMDKRREIVLADDGEEVFRGRVVDSHEDSFGQTAYSCEGFRAYLNDATVPVDVSMAPTSAESLFSWLVERYNDSCSSSTGRINVGINDGAEIWRGPVSCSSAGKKVWQAISDDLLKPYGGIVRMRSEAGVRYVDWLADGLRECSQRIEFGVNLTDYMRTVDGSSLVTRIAPYTRVTGEDGTSVYMGIDGVPDRPLDEGYAKAGSYVVNLAAEEEHGVIQGNLSCASGTDPESMIEEARRKLANSTVGDTLEISSVDLSLVDPHAARISPGDLVRVTSAPHGFDAAMLCRSADYLPGEGETVVVLGAGDLTLTSQQAERIASVNADVGRQADLVESISRELKDAAAAAETAQRKAQDAQDSADEALERLSGLHGTYVHVMFSENADGSGMTPAPTEDSVYMGVCSDESPEAPATASSYEWVRVKGDQGVSIKGDDGSSSYLHVRYSDDGGATFTEKSGETPGQWIGTCVTDYEEDPDDTSAYTWAKIKGDKGDKGDPGTGVMGVVNYYLASSSNEGVTTSTPGWTDSVQDVSQELPYLWNYEVVVFSDGSATETAPCVIGAYGASGVGISSIKELYLVSDKSSGVTSSTTGWTESPQATTVDRPYLWNIEVVTYTDGSTYSSAPAIIGTHGETGPKGEKGDPGASVTGVINYYLASPASSGVTESTPGWTTEVQNVTADKKYLWNYEVVLFSDGGSSATEPCVIGSYGDQGQDGKGISSITEYYLTTSASSGVTTSTAGWSTTPTATSTDKPYLWNYEAVKYTDGTTFQSTPAIIGTHGAQGPKGDQGDPGVGVTGVVNYYLATNSSSGVTSSTSGWTTSVQSVSSSKKYLWNYEVVSFSDGTSSSTPPCIIGSYGDKGDSGSPGAAGRGISSIAEYYLVTSASSGVTTSTAGWSTTPSATTTDKPYLWNYERVSYTDGTSEDSAPAIIGTHGAQGPQGNPGTGVTGVSNYYLATASSSGVTVSTSGWTTAVQQLTSSNRYLWNYEVVSFSDGSSAQTEPCIIGVYGDSGRGISSITEYYLTTSASSGVTTSTAGWSTTPTATSTDKPYLWNYELIKYSDGTSSKSTPAIIGTHGATGSKGDTGDPGDDGRGVQSSTVTYQASTSGTVIPTGTWSPTIPTVAAGSYLWTRTVFTYTDGTTSDPIYSVTRFGANGADGDKGDPGEDGRMLYGTSSTAASTAAKVASVSGFPGLSSGTAVSVKFTYGNTAASPTLNVSSSGAKPIVANGSSYVYWSAGQTVTFVYDGSNWQACSSPIYGSESTIGNPVGGNVHTLDNTIEFRSAGDVIAYIQALGGTSKLVSDNGLQIQCDGIMSLYSTGAMMARSDYLFDASAGLSANDNTYALGAAPLYYNSSGTTGTVTLSRSAANYAFLELVFSDGTRNYCSRLYNPDGHSTSISRLVFNSSSGTAYQACKTVAVSGTTLTQSSAGTYAVSGSSVYAEASDSLKLIAVIGWR